MYTTLMLAGIVIINSRFYCYSVRIVGARVCMWVSLIIVPEAGEHLSSAKKKNNHRAEPHSYSLQPAAKSFIEWLPLYTLMAAPLVQQLDSHSEYRHG